MVEGEKNGIWCDLGNKDEIRGDVERTEGSGLEEEGGAGVNGRVINYGSCRSKSPRGSSRCSQPGLTEEEGGAHPFIQACVCVDLAAYSYNGKNPFVYT